MSCQTIVCQNYVSCVCVATCQFGCNPGICQGNTLLESKTDNRLSTILILKFYEHCTCSIA